MEFRFITTSLIAATANSSSVSVILATCSLISLPINRRFLELSWVVILGAVLLVKAQAAPIMTASEQSSSKLGGRELAFEPANEQGSGPTRFLARGRNYQFLLSANEVRFAL